jgi:hypothetical protein
MGTLNTAIDDQRESTGEEVPTINRIIMRWEQLRIVFNFVLAVEVLVLLPKWRLLKSPEFLKWALICCIAANIAFLLGPLAESLGGRIRSLRFQHPRANYFGVGLTFSVMATLAVMVLARGKSTIGDNHMDMRVPVDKLAKGLDAGDHGGKDVFTPQSVAVDFENRIALLVGLLELGKMALDKFVKGRLPRLASVVNSYDLW